MKLGWPTVCLGVIVAIAGYTFLIEPAWVEVTFHMPRRDCLGCAFIAPRPAWTEVSPGEVRSDSPSLKIVQLSDLHLRSIGRTEKSVIENVNSLVPDILLLTGDVIDRPESMAALDTFLDRVQVAAKFAVLGNWEYWGNVDLEALQRLYVRHDVKLLVNECQEVTVRGYPVQIAGLDDFTAGKPDEGRLDERCGNTRVGRILMQHSPGYFSDPVAMKRSGRLSTLNLSGHTHGGQVAFLGYPAWVPPGSGQYSSGWYAPEHGDLYVSRGIGTSLLPARLGARPEIAVFEVR